MALECPRCPSSPLEERRVAPSGGGAAVTVHLCAGCRGVWLDGHVLAAICPTLAHLPEHRDEVALLGREGAGIARCLRCDVAPFEYSVLEVAIDFCLGCQGVWLDGDEYDEALVGGAVEVSDDGGGPYRRSARALEARTPTCAYCGEVLDPQRTFIRELGPACAPCHYAREQAAAERRAAEQTGPAPHGPGHRLDPLGRSPLEQIAYAVLDLLRP